MVQIPLSILSKILLTSNTTECIRSFVPVPRSPKKSCYDENPVHHFEGMEIDEMFQTATLTIAIWLDSGKFNGPISR